MPKSKHLSVVAAFSLLLAMTCGYADASQPDFLDYKSLSPGDAILKRLGVEKQASQDKAEMQRAGTHNKFSLEVAKASINADRKPDYIVRSCGGALYGSAGCQISIYTSVASSWQNLGGVSAISIVFPGTRTRGYLDHYYEGPGIQKPHLWKWNGHQYK